MDLRRLASLGILALALGGAGYLGLNGVPGTQPPPPVAPAPPPAKPGPVVPAPVCPGPNCPNNPKPH